MNKLVLRSFLLLVMGALWACGGGSPAAPGTDLGLSTDAMDISDTIGGDRGLVPDSTVPECTTNADCVPEKACVSGQCVNGSCEFEVQKGHCVINGKCYDPGDVNPDNPCMECIPAVSAKNWSPDDTNTYKDGDGCYVYLCRSGHKVKSDKIDCDDHDPCTEDKCNTDTGECVHLALSDLPCDDGNVCTFGDTCKDGKCVPGADTMDCDDNNPCTADECDPHDGCKHTVKPDGTACGPKSEEKDCKIEHICRSGVCVKTEPGGTGTVDQKICDDKNPCTDDDCVPGVGCVHKDNNALCSDHDPCTIGDMCFGTVCVPGTQEPDCDDGNPCTLDYCEHGVGCKHDPLGVSGGNRGIDPGHHISCDDNNACTTHSYCSNGECVADAVKMCNDHDPCTSDSCDPETGCVFTPKPDGAACEDHDVCTYNTKCYAGKCVPDSVANCDDHNECTSDRCDPVKGCLHTYLETMPGCNQLTIDVVSPDRGAELLPSDLTHGKVRVRGTVTVPKGAKPTLTLNGQAVQWTSQPGGGGGGSRDGTDPVSGDRWGFQADVNPHLGMNTLEFQASVTYQGKEIATSYRVQSFYYAKKYIAQNYSNPFASAIDPGTIVELSQGFFDDNQPSNLDDLAGILNYILNHIDFVRLIPSPINAQTWDIKVAGVKCHYQGYVTAFSFSRASTDPDIKIISSGLHVATTLRNVTLVGYVHLTGGASACPGKKKDIAISASADSMAYSSNIAISLSGSTAIARIKNQNLAISGFTFKISHNLLNAIAQLFQSQLEYVLKDKLTQTISQKFQPVLESVLNALDFNKVLRVPDLGGGSQHVVKLASRYKSITFTPNTAARMTFKMAAVSITKNPYSQHGSLKLGNCSNPDAEAGGVDFSPRNRMNLAMVTDLVNELFYSLFNNGFFDVTMDEIPGVSDQISNIHMTMTLPPIVNPCQQVIDPNQLILPLEIGDIRVEADIDDGAGGTGHVVAFALVKGRVRVRIDGANLRVAITGIDELKIDIDNVSGNSVLLDADMLQDLINTQLDQVLDQFNGMDAFAIAIPQIPINVGNTSLNLGFDVTDTGFENPAFVFKGTIHATAQ